MRCPQPQGSEHEDHPDHSVTVHGGLGQGIVLQSLCFHLAGHSSPPHDGWTRIARVDIFLPPWHGWSHFPHALHSAASWQPTAQQGGEQD
jgi:hypothetical protein